MRRVNVRDDTEPVQIRGRPFKSRRPKKKKTQACASKRPPLLKLTGELPAKWWVKPNFDRLFGLSGLRGRINLTSSYSALDNATRALSCNQKATLIIATMSNKNIRSARYSYSLTYKREWRGCSSWSLQAPCMPWIAWGHCQSRTLLLSSCYAEWNSKGCRNSQTYCTCACAASKRTRPALHSVCQAWLRRQTFFINKLNRSSASPFKMRAPQKDIS